MEKNNSNYKKIILNVPFAEKDEAKELGAWWDPKIKKWYVPKSVNPTRFKKWVAEENESESIREISRDEFFS